jgi:hypothetical protein
MHIQFAAKRFVNLEREEGDLALVVFFEIEKPIAMNAASSQTFGFGNFHRRMSSRRVLMMTKKVVASGNINVPNLHGKIILASLPNTISLTNELPPLARRNVCN